MTTQPERQVQVLPNLDPTLSAKLRRASGRLRSYLLVEGVAWVTAFLLLACGVQLFLDYATRGLQLSMRLALSLLILGAAAWLTWRRLIDPLRVPLPAASMASLLERRYPHLSSRLVSAVRFASGEVRNVDVNSPALMSRVVAGIGAVAGALDIDSILSARRAKTSGVVITGVVMTCIVAGFTIPGTLGIWFTRNVLFQEVEWPKRTRLVLDLPDGELIAARGDDVIIEATAQGVQPRSVEFFYETESGKHGREMMATIGSAGSHRYQYVFKSAREDFTFHLRGGDDRTDMYRARLLDRPRVVRSEMRVEPPAYAGLEPVTFGDGERAAQVLLGSRVAFSVQCNKPIASAELMSGQDRVAVAAVNRENVKVQCSPEQTHTYHFHLVDDVGLENRHPLRFSIRVLKDEAPHARLRIADVGSMITPQAILPLEVEFSDTYGLASAEIVYDPMREGIPQSHIDVPGFTTNAKTLTSSLSWPVAQASAAPGETISLWARAGDFDDVSGPKVTNSPETTLRIVTSDELLAELARREQEFRMDFERLLDAQEQLRSALLSAFDQMNRPDAPMDELASLLVPLERRQRNIAGSVNALRQQFEQILAELRINQLASREAEERLGVGIVQPLTTLAKRELVLAADLIRQWSRDAAPESASRIDPQQAEVLLQMRAVLSRMIQWEGYQEAVNMLRDILRLENELKEETRRKIEEQPGDIFDD